MKPDRQIRRAAARGVAETHETRWMCGDYGSTKVQARAARMARALLRRDVFLPAESAAASAALVVDEAPR